MGKRQEDARTGIAIREKFMEHIMNLDDRITIGFLHEDPFKANDLMCWTELKESMGYPNMNFPLELRPEEDFKMLQPQSSYTKGKGRFKTLTGYIDTIHLHFPKSTFGTMKVTLPAYLEKRNNVIQIKLFDDYRPHLKSEQNVRINIKNTQDKLFPLGMDNLVYGDHFTLLYAKAHTWLNAHSSVLEALGFNK